MRKNKREKLLFLLESYGEAHSTIRNMIIQEKHSQAVSLMALCQEGIDKIEQDCLRELDRIKKDEKKDEKDDLENLSELCMHYQKALFLSSECISGDGFDNLKDKEIEEHPLKESKREKIRQESDKKRKLGEAFGFLDEAERISKIIEEIIRNIPLHSQILFLPYKASMWDSMESVYLAAVQDPSCEALVMPITYFERTEDLSFGEAINERDKFPSSILLVEESFPFEEERPDVIYIHNPYDDWNYVSSVHPRYYSENLKKFTENLVYIPYFGTMGLCTWGDDILSAYGHMDYMVVQNEEHKRSLPELAQKKAIILGCPKFDRVIASKKKPHVMPNAWKGIASGRELLYFNSAIGEMLEDTESFLQKMEYIFVLMKEHPRYCLLWRPHPLLESTFLTMRNKDLPRYIALKNKFIAEKIGIYDDTAEIDRAVSLSFAYIGSATSSVVSLFAVAEKPILILDDSLHDLKALEEDRGCTFLRKILFESGVLQHFNDSWKDQKRNEGQKDSVCESQGFIRYSPQDGDAAVVYEGRFLLLPHKEGDAIVVDKLKLIDLGLSEEEIKVLPADEYGEAYFHGGTWILCPRAGNNFMILEEGKGRRKICLSRVSTKPNAFSGSYRVGDCIFCGAENYTCSIRFSLKNYEIKEITNERIRKPQEINKEEKETIQETQIIFNFSPDELLTGFLPWRKFLYGLQETILYTLKDFLDNKPLSLPYDQDFSHSKVREIADNIGDTGEKVYHYFQDLVLS